MLIREQLVAIRDCNGHGNCIHESCKAFSLEPHCCDWSSLSETALALMDEVEGLKSNVELLKNSLQKYHDKWGAERDELCPNEDNVKTNVKLSSLLYLSQWIINSINGGLGKPHATNICKIILNEKNPPAPTDGQAL